MICSPGCWQRLHCSFHYLRHQRIFPHNIIESKPDVQTTRDNPRAPRPHITSLRAFPAQRPVRQCSSSCLGNFHSQAIMHESRQQRKAKRRIGDVHLLFQLQPGF
ncbi:hypothetical protein BO99DRAFT_122487 [Aspergillus violaceofuscus CBS 115571]|uniref:Uncharacterized protein n=1 Tax=Aspergillus violaceofuscus (strain CBS 115571) TaxID=1450538 RepID=A0A2V5HMV0_ASPV1|nr:hypothetical protein BO99DRAFT_122487 [Aspergillus violaceofuscus CBS 115571]